jgi:hypothetical protein
MGRHSHADELGDEAASESAPDGPATGAESARTSAVADLQLVLHNPRLLGVCLAVVAVPFATYFTVITTLGKISDWPLFIGAPLVLAGISVGAVLDYAYGQWHAAQRAADIS